MDINKSIFHLDPKQDENITLICLRSASKDADTIKLIQEKARGKVYILPDQNSPDTF